MRTNKLLLATFAPALCLDFACTDPPLNAAYNIRYYNGTVNCGNVLMESDIGGTHEWVPPEVTFPQAEDGAYYTVMYIDPWVNMPNNGSWPDSLIPGDKAPARHWVVGNIEKAMLQSGDFSGATTVSAYKGPSPPWGSHPYGLFLFKQTSGKEDFPSLPSPDGIYNWDYGSFIQQYKLEGPVASNFHITQHADPRKASGKKPLPVSDPPTECSKLPLVVSYNISYYSGTVGCGNLLLESDIGGTHPWIPPTVQFPDAEPEALYTLMYIDPWVDMPNNGTWPDEASPGSKAPARHWVLGNLEASMLRSGDFFGATEVSAYKGPSPPWGSHPYGLYLYRQTERQDFESLPSPDGIYNWDYKAFVKKYSLQGPVASNYHVTQHMDPRMPATLFI